MTRIEDTDIRRRPDGSIDTQSYLERAHALRSRQAHDLVHPTGRPVPRPSFWARYIA